jgi:asparagine synthase (glutamine-hydrolysing)
MCGICGFICLDGRMEYSIIELDAMSESLVHRGPDSRGSHVDESVALANRRLSIVDLEGGGQPKYSENRDVCVVHNGEIYNHRLVRKELEKAGHTFSSDCDTEVIVHGYEELGFDFVQSLNGMFAIALWDGAAGQGMLIRDRLGIKPLYYARLDNYLVFGSEIKAVLAFPGIGNEVDLEALDLYLTLRYVPGTHTIFSRISKLEPGHALTFNVNTGGIEIVPYWNPAGYSGREASESETIEELRDLLHDSVGMRLMSDVPFGAFLSGGVDSSAVVAMMSQQMEDPVKTFSIGFSEESRLDERSFAQVVSESCATEHRNVDCTASEVENLPMLLYHFDEPFADPIIVPFFQVAKLAAEHVKVVLTGEGADEVFGGYTRYVSDSFVRRLGRAPRSVRGFVRLLCNHVGIGGFGQQASQAMEMAGMPAYERYLRWVTAFTREEKLDLLLPDFRHIVSDGAEQLYKKIADEREWDSDTNEMMYVELKTRLPECMLARTDRITMAVSLEARTPFLDHRLVERALRIPANQKVRGRHEKHILKKTVKPVLPASITRRRKQGLAVPFALWTRFGISKDVERILSKKAMKRRGIFDPDSVHTLLSRWSPREARHSQLIWSLLCFELWCRMYLDRDLTPTTPLSEVA